MRPWRRSEEAPRMRATASFGCCFVPLPPACAQCLHELLRHDLNNASHGHGNAYRSAAGSASTD
eukprot:3350578-Pleurochrysis_carterae.AAC.1